MRSIIGTFIVAFAAVEDVSLRINLTSVVCALIAVVPRLLTRHDDAQPRATGLGRVVELTGDSTTAAVFDISQAGFTPISWFLIAVVPLGIALRDNT